MLVCNGKASYMNKYMFYHLAIFKLFDNYTEKRICAFHWVKPLEFKGHVHTILSGAKNTHKKTRTKTQPACVRQLQKRYFLIVIKLYPSFLSLKLRGKFIPVQQPLQNHFRRPLTTVNLTSLSQCTYTFCAQAQDIRSQNHLWCFLTDWRWTRSHRGAHTKDI